MAFSSDVLSDIQKVKSGERWGSNNIILSTTVFEDGLKVGRFAKLDTGSIDNLDGSATPVIAGVVVRSAARALEDADTVDKTLYRQAEYMRHGLVTVDVKAGETPAKFGRVYVSNAGDANDGLATATNTDVAVNAEFIREVVSGVWLIYITPASANVTTHVGDTDGAHAASAISLSDAGTFTAAAEVEAALQEIYPTAPYLAAIADPGDEGAIPVIRSGNVALTTGATGETRTIVAPGSTGLTLDLTLDVDGGGDAVVTVATTINKAGNNTITLADAGDHIRLVSVQIGGSLVWRVVVNDGAALTTVQ